MKMGTSIWVPLRTRAGKVYGTNVPDVPLQYDGLPSGQYVTSARPAMNGGLPAGVSTMPILVGNASDAALCTKAIPNGAAPAADVAAWSARLQELVAAGRMSLADGQGIASALGLRLN
jgi:hypothetical protein